MLVLTKKILKRCSKWRFIHTIEGQKWIEPEGLSTGIQVFNSITKQKSPLVLRNPNCVSWYTCGPTVYDSAHIGHASSYVRIDIIQRILRNFFSLNLVTAMNVTDIDDKIIRSSRESRVEWRNVSRRFESEFWDEMRQLNVQKPDILLHVTSHIPQIVSFIEAICSQNKAYVSENGSVYFRASAFPRYGKLEPAALGKGSEEKENAADFALWKAAKQDEPSWESPWGPGRPGWHIECSTLASKVFGGSVTFHAGGLDLRFPHHENEEAQSCVFHKTDQWVDYWIHTGQLRLVGDQHKMSKSLKNTRSIAELLQSHSPDQFRMLCLLTRYRSAIDFDDASMIVARSTLGKLLAFLSDSEAYVSGIKPAMDFDAGSLFREVKMAETKILESLRDDFNTPRVVEVLSNLVSGVNRLINGESAGSMVASNVAAVKSAENLVRRTLTSLGFKISEESGDGKANLEDALIQNLVDVRQRIRKVATETRNGELFKVGDEIRDSLRQQGVEVKDHGQSSSWNRR